jgi:hypothetical protein
MPEIIECPECERLERAFMRTRSERQQLFLAGKLTAADEKRLDEEENLARDRLKDHHATHPK